MSCGLKEVLVFSMGLVTGTATTLTGKVLYGIDSTGIDGVVKRFEKPIFQTWGMFLAMLFALPIHWIYQWHNERKHQDELLAGNVRSKKAKRIPARTYFLLAYPAAFDLLATFFANVGLLYVTVSTFQLMKCTVIIFVALLKVFFLREKLQGYMWIGIFMNTVAVLMVGLTSLQESETQNEAYKNPAFGLFMIVLSCSVQACQYVYEETLMADGESAPPLIVVGMEGFWGLIFTSFVVYPIAYIIPGTDFGSNERFDDAIEMLYHSQAAQIIFAVYVLAILGYNVFAVFVTYLLDSIWHAILDNFRPITVWGMDLLLFYVFTHHTFGEVWTPWSFLKLGGMFVLLLGTAIYNGTIEIKGYYYEEPEDHDKLVIRTPVTMATSTISRSPLVTRGALKAQQVVQQTHADVQESGRVRREFLTEFHSEEKTKTSYGSFG